MAKVIVIDDSLSVCFAIERMLRAHGMEVVSHRSGETALHGLETEAPDLVLCDLVLPDIEGFQICTFMREHPELSSVPVIIISGIVDEEVRSQADEVGAVAVLKKPFASEEMLTLVENILRTRGALDSEDDDEAPTGPVRIDPEDEATDQDAADGSEEETGPVAIEAATSTAGDGETELEARHNKPPRILLATPSPTDAPPTIESSTVESPAVESPTDAPAPEPVNELLDRLEARLDPLASIEALRFACILSPEGELRGYGPAKPIPTELAALPQLMRAASNTATHTRHGEVNILTLETSNGGVLVVKPQEEGHLMILGLGDLSVLGKARYLLRRLEDSET